MLSLDAILAAKQPQTCRHCSQRPRAPPSPTSYASAATAGSPATAHSACRMQASPPGPTSANNQSCNNPRPRCFPHLEQTRPPTRRKALPPQCTPSLRKPPPTSPLPQHPSTPSPAASAQLPRHRPDLGRRIRNPRPLVFSHAATALPPPASSSSHPRQTPPTPPSRTPSLNHHPWGTPPLSRVTRWRHQGKPAAVAAAPSL